MTEFFGIGREYLSHIFFAKMALKNLKNKKLNKPKKASKFKGKRKASFAILEKKS
jgi:hypothetical protein